MLNGINIKERTCNNRSVRLLLRGTTLTVTYRYLLSQSHISKCWVIDLLGQGDTERTSKLESVASFIHHSTGHEGVTESRHSGVYFKQLQQVFVTHNHQKNKEDELKKKQQHVSFLRQHGQTPEQLFQHTETLISQNEALKLALRNSRKESTAQRSNTEVGRS